MKRLLSHRSAKPSHYNQEAIHYDTYNEENSKAMNRLLVKLLKQYKVKTVLDLTCGTGSQVLWLAKKGFITIGSDFNAQMLKIAKRKVKQARLNVQLYKGDMRNKKVGKFDAVITIFNAIGHLTKADFEKALKNIHRNLNNSGIYLFDIFNLNYLLKDNNIVQLTIDWQKRLKNLKIREIQYSTINEAGILASFTTAYTQRGTEKTKTTQHAQTLQIYTATQLKEMLQRNNFKVLGQYGIDGSKFNEYKTERILTIAKKLPILSS